MSWQCLPPAGNTIIWTQPAEPDLAIPGYDTVWVQSGTAALALALLNQAARHPDIAEPEVIVPAYCCPDLLAAAQYAGYKAIVVDVQADDPSYDMAGLSQVLNARTLAVIAINFLGIRERLEELRAQLAPYPKVALMEDNAQWFPEAAATPETQSSYLTFSFGRGKAIGLLAGGLVAVRKGLLTEVRHVDSEPSSGRVWPVKAWLVNRLAHPRAYYWLNRIPQLKLGETRYHALDEIRPPPERVKQAFRVNYERYRQRERHAEAFYDALFEQQGWNRLSALWSSRRGRLLRYPVLCRSSRHKEALLMALVEAGLGASALYGVDLARVNGVATLSKVEYPRGTANAAEFAARLLTLPTHEHVSAPALERIAEVVRSHS